MKPEKQSPTSVEIVARCRRKFFLRLRYSFTIGVLVMLVDMGGKRKLPKAYG